jgi:hypothetical protein
MKCFRERVGESHALFTHSAVKKLRGSRSFKRTLIEKFVRQSAAYICATCREFGLEGAAVSVA